MSGKMVQRIPGLLILFFLAVACMFENENPGPTALLEEAKMKLAPDKRTTVFHVKGELHGNQLLLKGEIHSSHLKQQLFEFIKQRESYTIVDSLAVLPQESLGDKRYGVVSISVANLRSKPGHHEELVTQVIMGTPLKLLKEDDGWYLVQAPDDYLGWTDDVMAVWSAKEYAAWLQQTKIIVTSTYTHSYLGLGNTTDIVSDLVAGNILRLKTQTNDFFEVEYPDGRAAFVARNDAQPLHQWLTEVQDTPERIIATAKRFKGVPYLWGGTSAKTLDCSGFTKTVYFLNGVLLPRDANQQAAIGEPVSIEENFSHLRKGDLVFFGRKATAEKKERITHVGIYIDSLRFIHEGGDVRVNSFDPKAPDYSEFRTMSVVRATRIIGVGEENGVRRLKSIPYFKSNENQ